MEGSVILWFFQLHSLPPPILKHAHSQSFQMFMSKQILQSTCVLLQQFLGAFLPSNFFVYSPWACCAIVPYHYFALPSTVAFLINEPFQFHSPLSVTLTVERYQHTAGILFAAYKMHFSLLSLQRFWYFCWTLFPYCLWSSIWFTQPTKKSLSEMGMWPVSS